MMSLIAKLRQWARMLDGIDDPQGEYLLGLDHRIRHPSDCKAQSALQSLGCRARPLAGGDFVNLRSHRLQQVLCEGLVIDGTR